MALTTDPMALHHHAGCAFVPTMGALHAGHLALIRRAAELARPVVVSIFVNPTQFGPNEDYTRYPRMLDTDAKAAVSAGADVVFAPGVDVIYPPGESVPVPSLPKVATEPKLEDGHRPAHFAGVCQVVARLFDLVKPSCAIFGEKDFQQLRVIEAMVQQAAERWNGVQIVPHPTVRENDGLAMSSRNMYLKPEQRHRALGIWRALSQAQEARTPVAAETVMREILKNHDLDPDYSVVRDAQTLLPIESFAKPARALIAARLDNVRLIDNTAVGPGGSERAP